MLTFFGILAMICYFCREMGKLRRIRRIKNIRIHREGTDTLVWGCIFIVAVALFLWKCVSSVVYFWVFVVAACSVYCVIVNFFRCPIRKFPEGETEGVVVAPADGRIVVVEEVEEKDYFHDRRLMVSIFMGLHNVHANWFPVDGRVVDVKHFNGNFHRAWLPKASEENEHADTLIEMENGEMILCRQVAGALARRIVTYAKAEDDCFIDEHLGFIKFGSRVDLFLPLSVKVCVEMGQSTVGDQTVIARL